MTRRGRRRDPVPDCPPDWKGGFSLLGWDETTEEDIYARSSWGRRRRATRNIAKSVKVYDSRTRMRQAENRPGNLPLA